jgi:parvulin-like peptidyl-prolyl isomerase
MFVERQYEFWFKEMVMRKISILFFLLVFLIVGCASKKEDFKLKEGTEAYQLAKDLAITLPSLDPDLNKILIHTDDFNVATGEVIQGLQENFGSRVLQLKDFEEARLKDLIEKNAVQLAEKNLLLGEAIKAKSSVTVEELSAVLNQQYTQAGSEEKYLEMLEGQGLDIAFVKKNLEEELKIRQFLDKKLDSMTQVTEDEIQQAYNKDKTASVQHILLLTQGKNDAEKVEAHKKMEELLARARNGEDFAGLAKENSEDPGSKENGGLYEDFERGAMVKPFEDAAFSVPVGEISDIVETNYGYHILLVVDRKRETRPLDEVRVELEDQLKQLRKAEVFESYFSELKEKSGFEIFPL